MLQSTALAAIVAAGMTSAALAETCRASHYGIGDGFHGRRTASGEQFNAHGLTTAHRTKAFGTIVTVTSLATGRSVAVRVNDRGPALWTGKCLDLSYGAARSIGLTGNGLVRITSRN